MNKNKDKRVEKKALEISGRKGISIQEAMHEARNEVQKDILKENSDKKPS
ncbi:MAG: hypothetical protein ACOCWO_02695 [Candidatus Muiribacteriaceae bacterium]